MSPSEAIRTLEDSLASVDVRREALHREMEEIQGVWERLGRIGGRRADAAAALLTRLKPSLAELARYANACIRQIDQWNADPFAED